MLYQIIIFVIIVIINHQSCVVLTFASSVPVVCPHWRAHCWSGPGCCNSSTGHLGRHCYFPITDLVLVWDQSSVLCRSSTRHPCTCWLTSVMSSLSVVSLVPGLPWQWLDEELLLLSSQAILALQWFMSETIREWSP